MILSLSNDGINMLQYILFLLLSQCSIFNYVISDQCENKNFCGECISDKNCVWCAEFEHDSQNMNELTHCGNKSIIKDDWCPEQNKIDPKLAFEIIENNTTESFNIFPQKVRLKMRLNEEYTVNFSYYNKNSYPLDLYFLLDLSKTMESERVKLANMSETLIREIKKITRDYKIGLGSFVDKNSLPFQKPNNTSFAFTNYISLEEITPNEFSTWVSSKNLSNHQNYDDPEGILEAALQAIVCQKELGWRIQARHILAICTDDIYHIAGDGILAGILEPNDGMCHIETNTYKKDISQDYPSIQQVDKLAKENYITVLFIITQHGKKRHLEDYKELLGVLNDSGNMKVVEIEESNNIVEIIKQELTETILTFDKSSFSRDFVVELYSNCSGTMSEYRNDCKFDVGKFINFEMKIKLINWSNQNETSRLNIPLSGIKEGIEIEVSLMKHCPCDKPVHTWFVHNSEECSGKGNLTCGMCKCQEGRYGSKCQCDGEDESDVPECEVDGIICSNKGKCICNKCECDDLHYGRYCQCNNYGCPKRYGELCGGSERGKCVCNQCNCLGKWHGKSCEYHMGACTLDGKICSNHGYCNDGYCKCDDKYTGIFCEECVTCCFDYKDCVDCLVFHNETNDCSHCSKYTVVTVDKIHEENLLKGQKYCEYGDKCIISYIYEEDDTGHLKYTVGKSQKCPPPINVAAFSIPLALSIIIAGIILCCIWRISTYLYDKKEYSSFIRNRDKEKWNNEVNPLYHSPTSKFINPMYKKEY